MIAALLLLALVAIASPSAAQSVEVANVTVSSAVAVRCVNTAGNTFESCGGAAGPGGGTTDTDDGSIAGAQTVGLEAGLTYAWDGSNWVRVTTATTVPTVTDTAIEARLAPTQGSCVVDTVTVTSCPFIVGMAGSASVTISGTWTGTLLFKVLPDGATALTTQYLNLSNGLLVTGSTANGSFYFPGAGGFRALSVTGPTSTGSATVTWTGGATSLLQANTNTAQVNAAFVNVGTGAAGTGTQRVAVASDSQITANAGTNLNTSALALDATLVSVKTSVETIDNIVSGAGANITQFGGTNVDTNSGNKSAGTLRVVLATDQPALTNKLLVTPDSVALPANQSVNAAQFGGTNVSTGSGAGGAGIPRVTVSNDSTVGLVAGAALVGKVGIDQTTPGTTNRVDIGVFPDNEPFNVAQVNGATVNVGVGAAGTGTPRVTTSTDSTIGTVTTVTSVTQNADVRQATAANLNVRSDDSGATGSAVPARAAYIGLNDGTNVIAQKAHSAASDATVIVTGMGMASPTATWCVNHTPAAAAKATISQGAAGAGVRHVITTYSACFAAGATAGPVQTFTIRDGATGAGTVLWSGALAAPVNDSTCTTGSLYKVGTAATAATIEFGAAGAAATIETVSMCGYDVQ